MNLPKFFTNIEGFESDQLVKNVNGGGVIHI